MRKSVVNYHPKPCASERTRSPCRFASLFHFSAKQCVLDAHLRVRENPDNPIHQTAGRAVIAIAE